MVHDEDSRLQDIIAEELKDYKQVNQENILRLIQNIGLRGYAVDRDKSGPTLYFDNTRTGKQVALSSLHLNRLIPRMPKIRQFHEECNTYLKQVRITILDAARTVKSSQTKLDGLTVEQFLRQSVLPRAQNTDNPRFCFEHQADGKESIQVFSGSHGFATHVFDRSAKIELRGPSEWTLNQVRASLGDYGFDCVIVEHRPIRPGYFQRLAFASNRLWGEIVTLSNIAKLILLVVGSIATLLVQLIGSSLLK